MSTNQCFGGLTSTDIIHLQLPELLYTLHIHKIFRIKNSLNTLMRTIIN